MQLKKSRLTKQQERLWNTLIFMIKLLLFSIPMYVLLTFSQVMLPLQSAVSSNTVFLLRLMGFDAGTQGLFISISGANPFIFLVSEDCTGWKSMLFLIALVSAVPAVAMRKRLTGFLIGIPIIYAGNLARIILVVIIEQSFGLPAAILFHDVLWQLGLIALVLAVWLAWFLWVRKAGHTKPKRAARTRKRHR
jgi:exosortase/archaeosortase family protein